MSPTTGVLKLVLAGILILAAASVLTGCMSTGPYHCPTCIGPYDLTLSSHREALGL